MQLFCIKKIKNCPRGKISISPTPAPRVSIILSTSIENANFSEHLSNMTLYLI